MLWSTEKRTSKLHALANQRPAALGYSGSASSSLAPAAGHGAVLPQPSGLRTLGSKESMEKEAEQLKKMRKQGKGGTAGQVRTKVKQVNDKIAEADELITKVMSCEHLLLCAFIYSPMAIVFVFGV